MNNRAILVTAVVLAFIAGFMSAEIVFVNSGMRTPTYTVIESNGTKIISINDRDYYPIVIDAINSANKSINMVMFEIKWYGNPDKDTSKVSMLGRALANASDRGVDVKVILENGKTYGDFTFHDFYWYVKNWTYYLESHGAKVKVDWSNQTTHDKLIIIDDEIVIVGSTNWSTSALDYNHEANVYIEGKEVAQQYNQYFYSLWNTYS